ncbi:MAG TPA: ATP-dependent protease ATPase subunit HslU [bacterium]|nr:ATP-dependent protease ATPase subunit HslU [bacterium]
MSDEMNKELVLFDRESPEDLTPSKIVEHLDRYIVGQKMAKRVVAVALRNRVRRAKAAPELRDEIIPKNILMIGPTGVGKTEIARRLSALARAPFIKIEATKYTEVGYVGRDVESMIRDLTEAGVRTVKRSRQEEAVALVEDAVMERLLDALLHSKRTQIWSAGPDPESIPPHQGDQDQPQIDRLRERYRRKLSGGELDSTTVEVEVSETQPKMVEIFSGSGMEEMGVNMQDILGNIMPRRTKKRKVSLAEARRILTAQETEKLIDMEAVTAEALELVEQAGIIFIDEIDKIAVRERGGGGPDVSREGVQRDILPIVEGCTVVTKYGPVKTDHILFIAAGAFSTSKPSDLIPELQGRFPLRVELDNLGAEDFIRILTEPKNALIKQYVAMLESDGVQLEFTEDGVREIAAAAARVNVETENIGARRLHTLLEKVLEDISFGAPDTVSGKIRIDAAFVRDRLKDIVENVDLSRYIL